MVAGFVCRAQSECARLWYLARGWCVLSDEQPRYNHPDWCSGHLSLLGYPCRHNMRIRVPLSRKLNPGDAIWMIFWVSTPIGTLSAVSVEDIALTVSYASRANYYVCSK